MSLTQSLTKRAAQRSQYYDKLLTNLKKNGPFDVSFDINICDEIFNFQRNPFYHSTCMDFYQFIISATISRFVQGKQSWATKKDDKNNNNKNPNTADGGGVKSAITGIKYNLYRLSVNHPLHGRMKLIKQEFNKENMNAIFGIYLYENKKNKKLICYIEAKGVLFTKQKIKLVKKSRSDKYKRNANIISKSEIEFVKNPSMVGQISKKGVFLSSLKYDDITNNIYSNVYIDILNGFDNHLYLTGTGDHINAAHISDACLQFIYLIVRNCHNQRFRNKMGMNQEFLNKIDENCVMTVYKSDVEYKRFVELGLFKLRLIKIQFIHDEFTKKMNIPYGLNMIINVEQNDYICSNANLYACPVFLSSNL